MATNTNTGVDIRFGFKLESVEVDLQGRFKALFRHRLNNPLAKLAGYGQTEAKGRRVTA